MELIKFENQDYQHLGGITLALGEFDGLHLAHQKLINETIKYARENNLKAAVLTFDPHPDFVLKKRPYQGYITPLTEKAKTLAALGIDYLIVVNFTEEFASLLPEEFENNVLGKFDIRKIFIGFDYRYGAKGRGNSESLKAKYPVYVLERIDYNNKKMGSEGIRELLTHGRIQEVTKLLGRYYNIVGKVVPGNKVGRKLGIRTANINLEEDYQYLKKGVYAVFVNIDSKRYFGVCNIGHNPTINYQKRPRLEVHILDYEKDLYGKYISIDFVEYLRPEIKFSDPESLVKQIEKDIINAKKILEEV
ncbi:MAG TPA: riboflavin biosynthesis protein RibF [Acholeplasmataceae bacterium]|nr:riboflavin biosynthesis protein RibF [Acholeplasmataceae bacterium]